MKHNKKYLFALLLCMFTILALFNPLYAQHVINVPPGYGTLNYAIDVDTIGRERYDIFILEREGIYILESSIRNNYPITIMAEEGEGLRPKILPGVFESGTSDHPFLPMADLTLKGLYIRNLEILSQVGTKTIRFKEDSLRIVIDDCYIDSTSQSHFRFDHNGIKLFISNSTICNSLGDYLQSRIFDDRGNYIDSLVVVNCTFYNVGNRVLRDDGGYINYSKFDHCTFVNVGRCVIDFGEVVEAYFTNNMVVNYSILGRDTSGTVKFDTLLSSIHIDSLKSEQVQGLEQKIIICNNNFYRDSVYISALPDSVTLIPLFNKIAQAYIDKAETMGTILNEPITFTNVPIPIPEFITNFWAHPGVDGIKGYGVRVLFDVSGEPFDFSYPATTQSYTAGTDGLPLGDLRWFDYPTAVEAQRKVDLPISTKLLGNYPNPFNPTTTICFELPETSYIQLVIYNISGQKVCTLVSEEQDAGYHSIQWNGRDAAGNLLPSGIYLYKLKGNHFVGSRKMSLIK